MAVMKMERPGEMLMVQQKKEEEQCASVFFKWMNGKTLCLMVNLEDEDIGSIKKRLAEHSQINNSTTTTTDASFVVASKDLFLVWNGKPLDDDLVLRDYHFSTGTIFCHKRNRGGCFALSFSVLMVILASILGSTVTCGASLIMVPILLPLLLVLPLCCL